jgi:hypothetical protein
LYRFCPHPSIYDATPATTALGFARFFLPLLKPVLGMGGHPAIRQQGFQSRGIIDFGGVRREAVPPRRFLLSPMATPAGRQNLLVHG